jgi:hydroxymethylbilane synthase
MKDLPTKLPAGLTISAIPEREDPRDALLGLTLVELREGSRVGTASLRRSAQLRAFRPGLHIEMLRGNVDTRLRKLDEGKYDAIVLAAAGLRRLGWQDRIRELLPVEVMCPAVGQGALAIETRDDGGPAQQIARQLNDGPTSTAVTAERALLEVMGGGCQVPIGAHAIVGGEMIYLRAIVAAPDGSRLVEGDMTGSDPAMIGRALGLRLLAEGAAEILKSVA